MNTIGALPPDRAAASLTRVWKRLSECFEAELKLAGPHGATPLRTVIEEDFPLKKELDFADTVSVCDDDEVVRPVALSTLDAVDPDSARAGDTLSGIALDLIEQLRDNMIGRLTGALLSRARPDCVGLPWPQTRDAWHSQIVTATGGENAVVWVDENIFETAKGWSEKIPTLRVRCIGPAVAVRRPVRALLFPLASRLIARAETLPLTLGHACSPAKGKAGLHCWYHYRLYIAERAEPMLRSWM